VALRIFFAFFVLFAALMSAGVLYVTVENVVTSRVTTAEILEVHEPGDGDTRSRSARYLVRFTAADGNLYEATMYTDSRTAKRRLGERFQIRYIPRDPRLNVAAAADSRVSPAVAIPLVLLLVGVVGARHAWRRERPRGQ
jgi:hypothetical protein